MTTRYVAQHLPNSRHAIATAECEKKDSDVAQVETELAEVKSQAKMIFRRLNRNSEQQASIESGHYTLQYAAVAWKCG